MPIYEYLCEHCGRITEVMQKVNDRPPSSCPECGSKRLAKLVSRTAFQLKGGGWYADLYGSPRKKEGGKEPGGEGGKEAASEGGKEPKKDAAGDPAREGAKDAGTGGAPGPAPTPGAGKKEKRGAKKGPGKGG
ncbi:MAG TPA: zinc ribbon domain-containing protein [Anaeromyxobacteraceae bacterium]|nr:zinc ribbon domain-containing protein [Anaeromyxobacteraceae bacterium]